MDFSTLPQWPSGATEGNDRSTRTRDRGSWIAAIVIGLVVVLGLGWLLYEFLQFFKQVGGLILMPPG